MTSDQNNTPRRPNLDNLEFLGRALDFVETYNFDRNLLRDVVRYPESREKDPHGAEVGYPIYRFRRGDITVVVGFRDLDEPHILHVWLHTPDDDNAQGTKGGAGGPATKTPHSVSQLRGWLMKEGCRLEYKGSGQRITYDGIFVGTLHLTPSDNRGIKNSYTHLRNKLAAIKAKQRLAQDIIDREGIE